MLSLAKYVPIATPIGFLWLKWIITVSVGAQFVISSPLHVEASFPAKILWPSDFFWAGLIFDISMMTLFFRLLQVHPTSVQISSSVALASLFLALFIHLPGAVWNLHIALAWGPVWTTNGPFFVVWMFVSAVLSFLGPYFLVQQ